MCPSNWNTTHSFHAFILVYKYKNKELLPSLRRVYKVVIVEYIRISGLAIMLLSIFQAHVPDTDFEFVIYHSPIAGYFAARVALTD